jgi:DNA-binding transcriptional regulator YiaG
MATLKNAMEQLVERLQERFPEAEFHLDRPDSVEASWWLDIRLADYSVTVEWRPGYGFGLSSRASAVYGERSDEVYPSEEEAYRRIVQLLLSGSSTLEVHSLSLAELRRERDLTQIDLARRLSMKQASLSKMERRGDMLVGSLRALVQAMGGVLEIRASFSDAIVRIQFDPPKRDPNSA